jgi:hypothetical protein
MAGVDLLHVPYRGAAPALTDLMGAQVQVMFPTMPAAIQHIRGGKLRALAVTSGTRSEALPDIPTVSEFVPGYEARTWYGVGTPKNTPDEIVEKLNKEIDAALDNTTRCALHETDVTSAGHKQGFGREEGGLSPGVRSSFASGGVAGIWGLQCLHVERFMWSCFR